MITLYLSYATTKRAIELYPTLFVDPVHLLSEFRYTFEDDELTDEDLSALKLSLGLKKNNILYNRKRST